MKKSKNLHFAYRVIREDFSADMWQEIYCRCILISGRTETKNKESERRSGRFSVTYRQDELNDKI